uniref:Anaphase-promoting complex subunit 5 n=1 Tax=Romanomermis culicivorax TaxID=13658 RepID=A0A915J394_ROMCU
MYWEQLQLYMDGQKLAEIVRSASPITIFDQDDQYDSVMSENIRTYVRPKLKEFNDGDFFHKLNLSISSVAIQQAESSKREFKAFVDDQIFLLLSNPRKAATYDFIEHQLQRASQQYPHCSQWLFLKYLNARRFGDFAGAKSALHEYFDWSAVEMYRQRFSNFPLNWGKVLRYGPFCLARLNRLFGYKKQAIAHIQESITKAQEASDAECLQFAIDSSFNVELCTVLSDFSSGKPVKRALDYLQSSIDGVGNRTVKLSSTNENVSTCILSTLFLTCGHFDQCLLEAKQLCQSRICDIDPKTNQSGLAYLSAAYESQSVALCNLAVCYASRLIYDRSHIDG